MTPPNISKSITRKSASNLALTFCLLPKQRRLAMATLYAFCREVDDVADNTALPVEERRLQLEAWREDIRRACAGLPPHFPVTREFQPVIRQFQLPLELLEDLIRGCEMDLDQPRYPDLPALETYCYRVASVVGLLSIRIFGAQHPDSQAYAVALGKALQLTNILRDVGNDAARGRIYLPLDALARCQVTEAEILDGRSSDRFLNLAAFMARHARSFYAQARQLLHPTDRPAMVAAELMATVYWRLLQRIESRRFPVLDPQPVRLSRLEKLTLLLAFSLRHLTGRHRSTYGGS